MNKMPISEKYLVINSTLAKLKLNFWSRHTDMENKIMVKPKGKGVREGQIRSLWLTYTSYCLWNR